MVSVGGVIGLIVVWEVAVRLLRVPPYILPAPEAVAAALWSGLAVPITSKVGYYLPLWSTLSNAAAGFWARSRAWAWRLRRRSR